MKKDKEWLKNEVKSLFDEAYDSGKMEYYESEESIHRINSLVDQLDEPEKTYADGYIKGIEHTLKNLDRRKQVIPQFVADWIERQRKYEPEPVITAMNRLRNHGTRELMVWFESNPDLYARAWLDGYEVEKEKKYQVIIRDGEYIRLYLCKHGDNVMIGTNDNYIEKCPEVTYLTEQEIKDYDERYWAFAEEVVEDD